MTYAPASIKALASFWVAQGGVNLGIVGDLAHQAKGYSYHLGKDQLASGAYSARTTRDLAGLTNAASAIDLGRLDGSLVNLRAFSSWLVGRCRTNAPGTYDVREIIYAAVVRGTAIVMRWDRERGYASLPQTGEADDSHLTHTHVSFYRDSELRPKVGLFSPYFEEDMDDRIIPEARATVGAGPIFADYGLTSQLHAFAADVPGVQLYGKSATVAAIRIDKASGDAEDIHVGYVPVARITVADPAAAALARLSTVKSKVAALAADVAND